MGYIQKVISDIFSMGFDIVIPVSGNIIAVIVALALFAMRYMSYRNKIRKYGTKSRHGKVAPRKMPVTVPPVRPANLCDNDIAYFLLGAISRRENQTETGEEQNMDRRFGGAFGLEILRKAPDLLPGSVRSRKV